MFEFFLGYVLGKSSNDTPNKGSGQVTALMLLLFLIGCFIFIFFGGAKFFEDGNSFRTNEQATGSFERIHDFKQYVLDMMDLSKPLKKE